MLKALSLYRLQKMYTKSPTIGEVDRWGGLMAGIPIPFNHIPLHQKSFVK